MANALVGHSGFVGSTLLKQTHFDELYRSSNISDIRGKTFDHIVCAGAPAQKWLANQRPDEDRENIERLIDHLKTTRCKTFILISTVDVFKDPVAVDENSPITETGLHPYGTHRRMLEKSVAETFPNHVIVRLPGLVGPGLRKNIIFDLLHENNLEAIDSRSTYQFYPLVNLWPDIQVALRSNLQLVHVTAAPITVSDVALHGFNRPFTHTLDKPPARYDMRTAYANRFGGSHHYQYSSRETILAIRAYAQSEVRAKRHDD